MRRPEDPIQLVSDSHHNQINPFLVSHRPPTPRQHSHSARPTQEIHPREAGTSRRWVTIHYWDIDRRLRSEEERTRATHCSSEGLVGVKERGIVSRRRSEEGAEGIPTSDYDEKDRTGTPLDFPTYPTNLIDRSPPSRSTIPPPPWPRPLKATRRISPSLDRRYKNANERTTAPAPGLPRLPALPPLLRRRC